MTMEKLISAWVFGNDLSVWKISPGRVFFFSSLLFHSSPVSELRFSCLPSLFHVFSVRLPIQGTLYEDYVFSEAVRSTILICKRKFSTVHRPCSFASRYLIYTSFWISVWKMSGHTLTLMDAAFAGPFICFWMDMCKHGGNMQSPSAAIVCRRLEDHYEFFLALSEPCASLPQL